jgi:acyl dehydratase
VIGTSGEINRWNALRHFPFLCLEKLSELLEVMEFLSPALKIVAAIAPTLLLTYGMYHKSLLPVHPGNLAYLPFFDRDSKRGEASMQKRYFEDFKVGDRFQSPGITVTEAQVVDFAMRFDPQVFHLDAEAARGTPYGGLIASGFHTIALTFRLFLMTGALSAASLGSPGVDELRWLRPVRPGDTLHVKGEVVSTEPSASRSDRGMVRIRYTTFNQRGEQVLSMIGNQIIGRRPEG